MTYKQQELFKAITAIAEWLTPLSSSDRERVKIAASSLAEAATPGTHPMYSATHGEGN